MQTLEKNISDRVHSEVDNVFATVKHRIHYSIVAARSNLVIPTIELAIRSANAF